MQRLHVYISGEVQGVFFRAHTKSAAQKLGLKGFVKNLKDGSVEAVFEGDEKSLQEMMAFCKKGPTDAKIKSVKIVKEEFKGEFNNFEIKY